MSTLFVVVAGWDYEGSTPIRAFDEKPNADDFVAVCQEYEATRPPYPSHAVDAEISAWSDAMGAWRAAHPGGESGEGADYFKAVEVPFGTASNDTGALGDTGGDK